MTARDLSLDHPITPDQLVADALERAAGDLTARGVTLDGLPQSSSSNRSNGPVIATDSRHPLVDPTGRHVHSKIGRSDQRPATDPMLG
jgi:hypothetical protein